MEIPNNLIVRPVPGPETSAPALKAWQVGQLLSATVIGPPANGTVSLRIGNQTVMAQTQLPMKPGQTLELEVTRSGEQPQLKITGGSPSPADVQAQAMRNALPRQLPLAPLLSSLQALATRGAGNDAAGRTLTELARQLLSTLPTGKAVSDGAGMKQAVQNSGIFLEARLLKMASGNPQALAGDLKAGLLKLIDGLRALIPSAGTTTTGPQAQNTTATTTTATPAQTGDAGRAQNMATPAPLRGAPPQAQPAAGAQPVNYASTTGAATELLRQAEGGLARLQLNQIASLPSVSQPHPLWSLEVPITRDNHTDIVHLNIEEDESAARSDQPKPWSVTLAFNLTTLGPMHARILINGPQVSTTLWAERPDSAELITRHMDELRAGMEKAGLMVGRLVCTSGTPPVRTGDRPATSLLNTKA